MSERIPLASGPSFQGLHYSHLEYLKQSYKPVRFYIDNYYDHTELEGIIAEIIPTQPINFEYTEQVSAAQPVLVRLFVQMKEYIIFYDPSTGKGEIIRQVR